MKFDIFETKPCVHPTADDPAVCPPDVVEPTPDPEPTFRLVLKPGYSLRQVGEPVQYRTYLVSIETGEETEVEMGLTYRSSDGSLAIIGAASGRAFGVAAGIVNISVEWQDMIAFAQMEVTADCGAENVGMMLVIDNSWSMEQPFTVPPVVAGQAAYATRLEFAKAVAYRFAGEVDESKDYTGLIKFHNGNTLVSGLIQDNDLMQSYITAIDQRTNDTRIADAIDRAAEVLNDAFDAGTITKKVIILLSDGENKFGNDPVASAQAFKASGGVVVCVGARAHGDGFALLRDIATEGMFLNGLKTNSSTVSLRLAATKGYYCAGHCTAPGDETVYAGELNYTDFEHWDVEEDTVDLIGGEYPYETFNIMPGNGLYVDLAGSGPTYEGKIVLKEAITLVSGHEYRLSFKLSGNQREDVGEKLTDVRVFTVPAGDEYYNELINIDDFQQNFTVYTESFVATGNDDIKISFQHIHSNGIVSYGNLLDNVVFEDLTDSVVLFQDTFDTENPTYVEPTCVTGPSQYALFGYGYGYGYCPGYGCLNEPVGQQIPDPDPLPVNATG